MTAPAPVSLYRHFNGIVLESTLGTPILTPTAYIPVDPVVDFEPIVNLLPDTGMRGAPGDQYNLIAGTTHSMVGWGGPMYPDTIGFPLVGILGEVSISGANPYTHTLALLNSTNMQCPSYTVMTHFGLATSQTVPGFMFSDLAFKVDNGLVTYSCKGMGWTSTDQTPPTKSFSAALPLPTYLNSVSIGGSSTTLLLAGELNIKRTVTPVHTQGVQDAQSTWQAGIAVDGKMTLIFQDLTEWARFRVPATAALVWNINSSTSADLQFTMSKVQYLQGTKPVPNTQTGWWELAVPFKALLNSTDVGSSGGFSPMKVVLKNTINTGIFK